MSSHLAVMSAEAGLHRLTTNPCKLLDFSLLVLEDGGVHRDGTGGREVLAVVLSGRASFSMGRQRFERVGGRVDVFSGPPHAVYLPAGYEYDITGHGRRTEIALLSAPSAITTTPYLITPEQTRTGQWGAANFSRTYRLILTAEGQPDLPAQRLIVGETVTPSGNWGSFPPHKHDTDDPPYESAHEQMYFVRFTPSEGFGIARQYNDRTGDLYTTMRDNTLIAFPTGYHSYVIAPGYQGYALWFLAGQERQVAWRDDPAHAWVQKAVPLLRT